MKGLAELLSHFMAPDNDNGRCERAKVKKHERRATECLIYRRKREICQQIND